jgi:TonB family protein
MNLAVGVLVSALSVPVAAQSAGPAQTTSQQVYQPGNGVTFPILLRQEQPVYTDAARGARIEGVVVLEGVVQADGTLSDVRIRRSLDRMYGLDDSAVAAAKRWLFRPGQREGKPVPTVVTLELEFRLHNSQPPPAMSPRQAALTATPDDDFAKGAHRMGSVGLVLPIPRTQVHPQYTADAMRAKFQGVVTIEAVVMPDGTVGRSRIVKSLDPDFGLDREALAAANQWTFTPGTLNGVAVPVLVTLALEFRLK